MNNNTNSGRGTERVRTARSRIARSRAAALAVVVQTIAMIVGGICNIVYSLNVEGTVSRTGVAAVSVCVLICYAVSAYVVLGCGRRDIVMLQTVLWWIALLGFGFYAAVNLFGYALVFPAFDMTAFMRLLTALFTLPILAYNYIISIIPNTAAAFAAALAPVLVLCLLYTAAVTILIKADRKKNGKAENSSAGDR